MNAGFIICKQCKKIRIYGRWYNVDGPHPDGQHTIIREVYEQVIDNWVDAIYFVRTVCPECEKCVSK